MSTLITEPVKTEVTVADVLARAADILEEFDWRQGSCGSREDGSMCAVGAIYEASIDLGVRLSDTERRACCIDGEPERIASLYPLASWNDKQGRTKAEVVARLREAASEW